MNTNSRGGVENRRVLTERKSGTKILHMNVREKVNRRLRLHDTGGKKRALRGRDQGTEQPQG